MRNRMAMGVCVLGMVVFCGGGPAGAAGFDARQVAAVLVQQLVTDTAVQPLKGQTVAITPFLNKADEENLDLTALQERAITLLVQAKLLTVVERDRLDRALAELKLNASGLIDPASQQRLGQFLGAQYLLLGSVTRDGAGFAVDARLLQVETGTLVSAAAYPMPGQPIIPRTPDVTPPAAGGARTALLSWDSGEFLVSSTAETAAAAKRDVVCWLVETKIFGSAGEVLERWRPEITREMYAHPERYITEVTPRQDAFYLKVQFARVMRDLTAVIFGKITPRISVDTRETVLQRVVPDPAVQTVMEGALLQYGFQVVDAALARGARLRELTRQAEGGDARATAQLRAALDTLDADLAVVGESFAVARQAGDGFDARVEVKMVGQDTGRVFSSAEHSATVTQSATPGLDPTSPVAAKLALQQAAEGLIIRMATALLAAYGQPIYRVRVWKIDSLEQRSAIVRHLQEQLPGATVTPTQLDVRAGHTAIIEVMTKKGADTVAAALQGVPGMQVTVTSIACRAIACEVAP